MPQISCGPRLNRSDLNGIAISTVHPAPVSRVRTNQTASQLVLISRPSFATC